MSSKKKGGGDLASTTGVSLVAVTMPIDTSMTVVIGSTLGTPIMREGFVTETGLLPSSMLASTRIAPSNLTRTQSN
jgi:hypothetical protein